MNKLNAYRKFNERLIIHLLMVLAIISLTIMLLR